jgi:tetratricopeptide (TPR) repeat protein
MIAQPAQTNLASAMDADRSPALPPEDARPADGHPAGSAAPGRAPQHQPQKPPGDHRALLSLGELARQRGDALAALGYFEAAAAAAPERPRPRLEMALELRTLGRLDEAEAVYRELLQQRPDLVRALAGLGHVARLRGQPRQALRHYRAALALNPARTDLRLEVAGQLRKLARHQEAQEGYRAILAAQPDHARAREGLARLPPPEQSGLPPLEPAWLERDTFTRAAEWGKNLETLGICGYGMNLLTLAQDFAAGAVEEVKRDCILLHRKDKTKLLPLVSDWPEYEHVLAREVQALRPGDQLGYVPEQPASGWANNFNTVECHREFVYHREGVAALAGSTLSTYRRQVRQLLKAGAYVVPIGPENLDRVLACNDRWYAGKKERGRATYFRGRTVWTFENLPLLEPLGVRHLAMVLDDDVIGYAVGSHLGPSWFACPLHRGDREPWGVAPYLLSEISKLYPDRQWLNDGPAVRKPNLAWFKERFTSGAVEKQMTLGWIQA